MFDEALGRLKSQLQKISELPKTSARRPSPASAKTRMRVAQSTLAKQRAARRKQSLKSRVASAALSKSTRQRAAGQKRKHSHIAASTRRRQSKRDSRS
jgi:hypothetical protein